MPHSQPAGITRTFTASLDVRMKCENIWFASMAKDQPPPHNARIHPHANVSGDLRALEMAYGVSLVRKIPIRP